MHPEAKKNIDEAVNTILHSIKTRKRIDPPQSKPSDDVIAIEIKKEHIISINFGSEINFLGDEVSIFFENAQHDVGYFGEDYVNFIKLCEKYEKVHKLSELISSKSLRNDIFAWVKSKYLNNTSEDIYKFISDRVQTKIKEYEIWIPIGNTYIDGEIQIGNVLIRNFSKKIFDKWEKEMTRRANDEKHREDIKKFLQDERKNNQGYAVSFAKYNAEKVRAEEKALEDTELALDLRIFSPHTIFINTTSYTSIKGMFNPNSYESYIVHGTKITKNSSMLHSNQPYWTITEEILYTIKHRYLEKINSLISIERKNEFQENIVNTISLYSKSLLTRRVSDKLVYIFSAIESMLIKNENEPIQQNLADRLAFAISKSGEERMKIVRISKDAYRYRSQFVHHGLKTDDINTLNQFAHIVHAFILSLLENINNFKTKENMIAALEKMKYGH